MNLGVTIIRGHLWLAHNLKEKFLTRRQLSLETCLFGWRWWKRRMKAQGWAALQLSANDPHCWLQPTPRHTYSEACETEPSWDTQIRGSRCDEEPGACYIWELGSMLALFSSPLPPRPSLCVHGCDTTWYTKSTVLFCVCLCTIISNLLALMKAAWPQVTHIYVSWWTQTSDLLKMQMVLVEKVMCTAAKYLRGVYQGGKFRGSGIYRVPYGPISKSPWFTLPSARTRIFRTSSLTLGTIGCQMLHLWGVRRDLFACLLFFLPSYWWSWGHARDLLFILAAVSYAHISMSCSPLVLLGWISLCNLKSNLCCFFFL